MHPGGIEGAFQDAIDGAIQRALATGFVVGVAAALVGMWAKRRFGGAR